MLGEGAGVEERTLSLLTQLGLLVVLLQLPGMPPDESDIMALVMSEQITAASTDVAGVKKKFAEETLSDESVGIYVQDDEEFPNVKYLVYEQTQER